MWCTYMQESDKEVVEVMVKQRFVMQLKKNKKTLFQVRCEPQIKKKTFENPSVEYFGNIKLSSQNVSVDWP